MIRHAPSLGLGLGLSIGSGSALEPYPLAGRVLDLGAFTYTNAEVPDRSGEGNEAVLYSGRGVNLAGADYVELPDVGATKSITVLARSSTDTTLYATDDAAQTEDATAALVADGTWQEVTLTFTNAISGKIRLGSDGTSFFSGDLADARCKDASGNLLDQFYLNEHTDVAAAGLDGLPVIGRNGNIGQYVNCAAVVQEGFDSALAGLGAYGDKLWLDDISKNVSIPPTSIPDGATLTTKFYPTVSFCWLYDLQEINAAIYANSGSYSLRIRSGGINYSFGDGSEIVIGGFNVAEISRSGNTYSVTLNGTSLGSQVIPTEFYITHISAGAGTFPFKGLIDFISGSITWDGTEADAIANGWTVNGSPNTVAELRTTPPQVLGMDFNQYKQPDGLTSEVIFDPLPTSVLGTNYRKISFKFLGPGDNIATLKILVDLGGTSSVGKEFLIFYELGKIAIGVNGGRYATTSQVEVGQMIEVDFPSGGNLSDITVSFDGVDAGWTLSSGSDRTIDTGSYNLTLFYENKEGTKQLYGDKAISNLVIESSTGPEFGCLCYGKTPWKDTIGSNDGTESGTFEDVLIPESLNKGIDALGNNIEELRSSTTFNADESGYTLTPDDDSLDVTTEATWVLKGNFYGALSVSNQTLLAKDNVGVSGERCWNFYKSTADAADQARFAFAYNATSLDEAIVSGLNDSISVIVVVYDGSEAVATDRVKVYQDGSLLSATGGANLPTSLQTTVTDLTILTRPASDVLGNYSTSPISDIKIYNRALTAEEVAKFS